jgi:hypothetical protein
MMASDKAHNHDQLLRKSVHLQVCILDEDLPWLWVPPEDCANVACMHARPFP